MPGEKRSSLHKSKGIHDLTLREQAILVYALQNDTLTIQPIATDKARQRILTSRDPAIFGEAPGPESPHSRGRRGFVNGRIDWKGLPRLPEPSSSPSPTPVPRRHTRRVLSPEPSSSPSPTSLPRRHTRRVLSPEPSPLPSSVPRRLRKLQVFVEVPPAPASWRLRASQRRASSIDAADKPSAGRPDASDLVPQIACLTQDSQPTDITASSGTVDEEDRLDMLVGSQGSAITPVVV